VKQELTSDKAMKLALKGICAKGITITVPNKEEEVKKAPDLTKILPDRLYCPSSKIFPAADFFLRNCQSQKTRGSDPVAVAYHQG
jgi:hypothetical protein